MSSETTHANVTIREVSTIEEFDACINLQREAFGLPDLEISPRRHLIVSHRAGGWTLGAFAEDRLIGFVHHLAAVKESYIFGYSHMMAVAVEYQNKGVGAQLKWAQRARALAEGRDYIKWTFEPMRARNAHFNLNRLGVVVREYAVNFYGTDYATPAAEKGVIRGMDSDRLFASWDLNAPRVEAFSRREEFALGAAERAIEIPADFSSLLKTDPEAAKREVLRVRNEFVQILNDGFVCRTFDRDATRPQYLFYRD
ncbi:MAG TPA: GNAT family N-acetyltransferase [Chthoniobacterales bacterium]